MSLNVVCSFKVRLCTIKNSYDRVDSEIETRSPAHSRQLSSSLLFVRNDTSHIVKGEGGPSQLKTRSWKLGEDRADLTHSQRHCSPGHCLMTQAPSCRRNQ